MQLYLLRHGIAEEHGPDGLDASRRLTEQGVEKMLEVATGLARLIDPPAVILTSPKVRAKQTAKIVGEVFAIEPVMMSELADADSDTILRALGRRKEQSVMIVGHEPTFSEMVEKLIAGRVSGSVELKKGGCACVQVTFKRNAAPRGMLLWLATPRMLRRIRKL